MTGMVRGEDKRKQSSGLVNNAHGSQSPSGGMSVEGNTWTKGRLNSWDDTRYFLQLSTFLAQLPELFLQVKTWEWLNSGLLDIYTNINRLWKLFMYSTVCWRWWHSLCSFLPIRCRSDGLKTRCIQLLRLRPSQGLSALPQPWIPLPLIFGLLGLATHIVYPGKKFLCLFLIKD